ncbi:NTP transferase domain-containing protein [Pedobacter sp. L105]|uniref:nucleotidyltransferase family protein n=1 Tax=Pedobacter sp. L105 TaxID=1641871 RepID=UPI001C201E5E|nr:nucleotidyltransferase family protein [Pedobacter sp. L105]
MATGIIILAAGNSSRMGQPKQFLNYQGKTLLEIVSNEALKTPFRPVMVVLGAYAEEILKKHHNPTISYIFNENWHLGMSSSIATGLSAMLDQHKDIENVILSVADQVFISNGIFEKLLLEHELTGKNIIACNYAQTIGTPVLFHKNYFPELLLLSGNEGAKSMLKKHKEDTAVIEFELGHIDIDTETDYHHLIHPK